MKQFHELNFTGKEKFLTHARTMYEIKSSDYYKKLKDSNGVPSFNTFKNWFKTREKHKIELNKTGTKKKLRKVQCQELDDLVTKYIVGAESKLSEFGIGLSWSVVQTRAMKIAKELNANGIMSDEHYRGFTASRGWVQKLKTRRNLSLMKLVGEANTLSAAELEVAITQFRADLSSLMDDHDVDPAHVFNADQTGLYYRRFPCTTIVSADRKQYVKGTKAMKDKSRITAMVCTASTGPKVPIAFVGRAKNPRCFAGKTRPQFYTHNKKAWFNKTTTKWWFRDVFAPYFIDNVRSLPGKGEINAIVILDGCSAHNDIQQYLDANGLGWIHVITLPPNVTSHFQPMDQGVIAWLKKMYKYDLIKLLLEIYDDPEKMSSAIASRKKGGFDGVAQGVKPNVCMMRLLCVLIVGIKFQQFLFKNAGTKLSVCLL